MLTVATGIPTSRKNASCPAGEQIQSDGAGRRIMKLMRRVSGNVDRLACPDDTLLASKRRLNLAFEEDEGFP